jgi:hypothetical protein
MKELALMAFMIPGVQKGPSLRMVDLLYFSLVLFLLKMHSHMSNVEMVISVGGTQLDLDFAVSKIELTINLLEAILRQRPIALLVVKLI